MINIDNKQLHLYTDETASPYKDGENPYTRTIEDDEFDSQIINEFDLNFKEDI